MKWRYETTLEKHARISQWHDWFAWHPIFQEGHIMWLETVTRKAVITSVPYHGYYIIWEYEI